MPRFEGRERDAGDVAIYAALRALQFDGAVYTFAVLILTVWLMLMGAGGLCYPRMPRAMGVLFVVAGLFMLIVWAAGAIGDAPPITAVTSAALGLGQLWRFRDPAVRATHVAAWTAKS